MAFKASVGDLFHRRKPPPVPPASSRPGQPQPPIYRPLASDTRQIRLCTIEPGNDADVPVCMLKSHSLSGVSKYRCLSYVWGDAHDKRTIFLNGQTFEVTANLYAALCQLRHNGERKQIWIDAICINQADPVEKTAQVQMMADIYSSTEEVLIWLGEEPRINGPILVRDLPGANMLAYDMRCAGKSTIKEVQVDDSIAFKHVSSSGSKADFTSIAALFQHLASGNHLCDLRHFTHFSFGDGLIRPAWDWFLVMKALKDFSRLPWFSRTWTVQEVILAPKAKIMYGSHRFPWEDIIQAATKLREHASPTTKKTCACKTVFATMPHEHRDILRQWSWRVHDIQTIRLLHIAQTPSTWQLLLQCRSRQAGDPRDKVFALLGLGDTGRGGVGLIRIDYSLSVRQVYSAVTIAQIRRSRSLAALENDVAHALPNLPSWVVDWTAISKVDINFSQIRAALSCLYHASPALNVSTMLDYDEDGCELTLTGKAFDIIADFTDAFPITASECQTFIPIYERWKHFIAQLGGPRAAYVAGGTQEQAFHRTVVADSAVNVTTDQTRRASATDAQQFNDWLIGFAKSIKSGHVPRNDPRVNAEDMHVKAVLAHRRLMITASGYMGLAPATAAVGDSVYVLDGARMPSVLRPVAGSSRASEFQLVGPCFVQGIMDGEIESMERQTESVTLV